MGMGYGYGSMEDLAEKRRLRLEARYGKPADEGEAAMPAHSSPAEIEPMKPADPLPPPDSHRDPVAADAPRKKAGRPKGAKNKSAP